MPAKMDVTFLDCAFWSSFHPLGLCLCHGSHPVGQLCWCFPASDTCWGDKCIEACEVFGWLCGGRREGNEVDLLPLRHLKLCVYVRGHKGSLNLWRCPANTSAAATSGLIPPPIDQTKLAVKVNRGIVRSQVPFSSSSSLYKRTGEPPHSCYL